MPTPGLDQERKKYQHLSPQFSSRREMFTQSALEVGKSILFQFYGLNARSSFIRQKGKMVTQPTNIIMLSFCIFFFWLLSLIQLYFPFNLPFLPLIMESISALLLALYWTNQVIFTSPNCLQIDWEASPEQKKLCLNKGRDNQVPSVIIYW